MAKISAICLFCGSHVGTAPAHRAAAEQLGRALAERRITLVYGGGAIGLMGVAARAAMAAGGEVIGIIPDFLDKAEKGLRSLTRLEVVESMHERKARMFALSQAVIVLPGGLGTLDEVFELLTWRQLGLHDKPIILVDVEGYWRPLAALVAHLIATGFASASAGGLFRLVDGVDAAIDALLKMPAPTAPEAPPEKL